MRSLPLLSPCVLIPLLSVGSLRAEPPSYARHIQPFLTRYCVECHNASEAEGDLNLESYKALQAGGEHGPVLTPGKADTSRIVRLVEGKGKPVMPPKKAKQPGKEEVALLRAWVDAGAKEDSGATRIVLPDVKPRTVVPAPVAAVAFSPDGKLLAAAGRHEVTFFDVAVGELRWKLGGQNARVTALAFRPDGKVLAVASSTMGESHQVRLYDLDATTGPDPRSERPANVHSDVIHDLAFRPDGKQLASCGYDRLVKLWDVSAAPKEQLVLRDHSDSVYGVAYSPDGKLLASVAADRAVKVWDPVTGARRYTLSEATDWLYAVAWSPDGRHLAAAGVDRSIRVWEASATSARLRDSVFAHDGPVTRLAYSTDGKVLCSLSENRTIKAWDTAHMVERTVYPRQPEVPLSLALQPGPAGMARLAIGRYDGALVLLAPDGKTTTHLLPLKPAPPVLSRLSPTTLTRGHKVRLLLEGKHLHELRAVHANVPGWKAEVLPGTQPGRVEISAFIPATAAAGVYRLHVETAAGKSGELSLTVDAFSPVAESEPNSSPRTGQLVTLPATLVGQMDRAGDVDFYRFEATAGQEVGVQALTGPLGSKLEPVLQMIDPEGRVVAESNNGLLGHTCAHAGVYVLGIRDREYRGDPGMIYRLHAGPLPVITSVFPLGLERGTEADIHLDGVNLGPRRTVHVKAEPAATPGTRLPISVDTPSGPALGAASVRVGELPEVAAGAQPTTLSVPATGNGRIEEGGATQTWRFRAKKGQPLLLEVDARRQGSPLDSVLEILDSQGRPLPRATLRCLARTFVTFRDHDSTGAGIRIETWDELAVNDYLLVGSELMRIRELPRNPDDDCQMVSRGGKRRAYLGTTPTFHSMGQPMYKVAFHPPGATFPPNGLPVVTLYYRNDDGGGTFGKDSRLVFDPPADGDYLARVGDARGQGSRAHTYQLTVRPPRPSFQVRFDPTAPSVSAGQGTTLTVQAERIDDFDGPIELRLEHVPAGFQAPASRIPAGEFSTSFALYAEPTARTPAKGPPLELVARATIDGKEVVRRVSGGLPKIVPAGDIVTTTQESEVTLQPGQQTHLTVKIERRNGFKGRVPLEVRGLPHGARVLDVGLNGILITEKDTSRTITLYAEPWLEPTTQPFVVLARHEGKGSEHAARSVLLKVERK